MSPLRLLPLASLTSDDLSAWAELAQHAIEPNPFFESAFLLATWNAFGRPDISLLVYAPDGTWRSCRPVQLRRPFVGPKVLDTWLHPYMFLGTPLVDRDFVDDFAQTLVKDLEAGEPCRYAILRKVGDGPVVTALQRAMDDSDAVHPVFEESHDRAALQRHAENDYLEAIRPHHRREMNRQRRRLEDKLEATLAVRDRAGDPAAVDAFLRLEKSGWKGRNGTAMAVSGDDAEMFRAMCATFAEEGRLQLLSLQAGDRIVAMKCNMSSAQTLFCFKIAYDEQFSRYSPGVLLEIENMKVFHERRGEQLMDSCADSDNAMINRIWQDRRSIVTMMLGPSGATSWIVQRTRAAQQLARERRDRHRRTPRHQAG